MKTYVIYHRDCPDGMAAAWCAWRWLGEDATYIPLTYTDPIPDLADATLIYLLDFSFPRNLLLSLAAHADVIVLDHHKSAEAALAGIGQDNPRITAVFNMTRSGAQLAWAWFCPGYPEPPVISHIADRDLWTFALPETKAVAEAVMSYPYDFETFGRLILDDTMYERLVKEGNALVRVKEKQIASLLDEAQLAYIDISDGCNVAFPAVNAPYFLASDLANALLSKYPKAPFAGCYRDAGDGRREWSLRSTNERTDVSLVAAYNGGGGHRDAAGMSEVRPELSVTLAGWRYNADVD